ncbi:ABC transporter ATP-binding protein [Pilimelia anulata]|uniref:ABC transporter ATP-binding protein n=1 Tax=Pilimelia anulata TaxID=53371 RepID=A0A8J3B683_9ACTN|nr:ABC transporter ATP-binding protein [Pilimelia anulata]GGJ91088.1 ABC transporter ATP-binding protein [Pilimelia anulata]
MTTTLPAPAPAARRAAAPDAVALAGVTKTFGPVTAVDDLSLRIAPGEVVALLGPNGAGKTSTIDLVLGLADPTRGSVAVYGGPPAAAIATGAVAAVMQTGGLLKDFTVAETVRFTAALYARPRPVAEVLDRAGIADLAGRRVGRCSGGQQQRLRFALALLSDPDLLILDEPTTGMDVGGRQDFWSAMRSDTDRGRTVIFATHYLEEADRYADRIVLMRRGRVVADGTAGEIKALASIRTVRATLAGADRAALAALPGVSGVDVRGDSVVVRGRDSDAVAHYLLTRTDARHLEITGHDLEQAFLTLTGDDDTAPAGRDHAAAGAERGTR